MAACSRRCRFLLSLLLVGLSSIPVASAHAKVDPSRRVTLHLRDSTITIGTLVEATRSTVVIDPEGEVQFESVPAASVAYLVYGATGRVVSFPLEDPSRLSGQMPSVARAREAPGMEFRPVQIGLGVGFVHALPSEGVNMLDGYGSGPAVDLQVRWISPRPDPRSIRGFLGLGVRASRITSGRSDLEHVTAAGDTFRFHYRDLTLQRFTLDGGITTPRIGGRSFLYASGGLGYIHHSGGVQIGFTPGGSPGPAQDLDISAPAWVARIGMGGVYEPRPRWGIDLHLDFDVLIGEPERLALYDAKIPDHQGALFGLSLGVVREL